MRGRIPSFQEFVQMKAQEAATQVATIQRPSTALAAPVVQTRYGNDEASLMGLANRPAAPAPLPATPPSPGLGLGMNPAIFSAALENVRQFPTMPDYSGAPMYAEAIKPSYMPEAPAGMGGMLPMDVPFSNRPSAPAFQWSDNAFPQFDPTTRGFENNAGLRTQGFDYDKTVRDLVASGVPEAEARAYADQQATLWGDSPSVSSVPGELTVNRPENAQDPLISRLPGLFDAPLYATRERQTGAAYEAFQLIENWNFDTDYARYYAREYAGKDAWGSQDEWDAFRRQRIGEIATAMQSGPFGLQADPLGFTAFDNANDPIDAALINLPEYDGLAPNEKAAFRRGFIDAYENGYAPTKRVLTDIGVYTDQPTGEFFEPGERAAWEYVADKQGTFARVGETLASDPLNMPLGGLTALGMRTARRGAETVAREGAERAAREAGDLVLREGERVVASQENRIWVRTPNLRPGETLIDTDAAGNYVISVTGPGGATEVVTRAPVYTSRRTGEMTIADTVGSWVSRTSGNLQVGSGILLQTPDAILNGIPDVVIEGSLTGMRSVLRDLPVVGKLFQDEQRTLGIRTLHDSTDAIMRGADTRVFDRTDIGSAPSSDMGPMPDPSTDTRPFYGTGGVVGEEYPGPYPDQPSPAPSAPRMPTGRAGFDENIATVDGRTPGTNGVSAEVQPFPVTTRRVGGVEYQYIGDGNRLRVAETDDGMYVVQSWSGQQWDNMDLPPQPDLDSAVALATDVAPDVYGRSSAEDVYGPEQPMRTMDLSTDPTVEVIDNPNVPRVDPRNVRPRQMKLEPVAVRGVDEVVDDAVDAAPTGGVGDDVVDEPVATADDPAPWEAVDDEAIDAAPVTDDAFDVATAYPPDDPELPRAFGPLADQDNIAIAAAEMGYINPQAGNTFFERYRTIVKRFKQRSAELNAQFMEQFKKSTENVRDRQMDELNNAKKFYTSQGMHYATPDNMALDVEMMGESMRAYREVYGEPYPYSFRYGDDIAIHGDGPIPAGPNGQDLDMGVSITYDPDIGMAPRYSINYAGQEWWTTNIDNVIERAAFDPDDEIAGQARRFLRIVGKEDPRIRFAEKKAAVARVESGVGASKRGSIDYSRKRTEEAGGSWRTLAEGQSVPKGYDVRTTAVGKTQIYVPAKGKGSKPRVEFEPGRELDDGTVLMHSGFGGTSDMPGDSRRFRHIGPRSWRPDPAAFPTGPAEGPTMPTRPQARPAMDSKTQATLDMKFENGVHENMTLSQVHDHYWSMAERDMAELQDLKRMGGDADKVDAKTKRSIGGKLRKDQYATDPALFPDKDLSKMPLSVRKGTKELSQEVHERVAYLEMKWSRYGDLNTGSAYELAAGRAAWEHALSVAPLLAKERPLLWDMLHALLYRLPRTLLLADPITSWTYVMRNMISNTQMTGIYDIGAVTSRANWGNFRRNTLDPDNSAFAGMYNKLFGSPMPDQFRQSAGLLEEIADTPTAQAITGAKRKGGIGAGPKPPSTPTRRFLERIGLGFTAKVGEPFDWMRNVTRNLERASKLGAAAPLLQANLGETIFDAAEQAGVTAWRMGVSDLNADEISAIMFALRDGNGVFSRDDLYSAMFYRAKQGGATDDLADRFADRVTRDWIEFARGASDRTIDQINHIFPNALYQTNLDHYLSYVTLFHFWPTRAMTFMAEEMIRNPRLIVNWYRVHEGFERMAEEGEYPDAVKGLIRLWKSPIGFSLYSNPAALFMVTALIPSQMEYGDRDGTTWLGSILTDLRDKTGLAPVPMLDATMSLLGIYGDNYIPDIIPSRTYDLAVAGANTWLVASGHRPHTPFWDQKMLELREWATNVIPGISTIEAGNAGGYAYDLVGSMVLQQNPSLMQRMAAVGPDGRPTADAVAAKQEYLAIMENPADPRYRAAENAVYQGQLWTRAINLVFPFSVRGVMDTRAETVQLNREKNEVLDAGGTPTEGQRKAGVVRGAVADTPEALRLSTQQSADIAFGSESDRKLHDIWTSIAFPDQMSDQDIMVAPGVFMPAIQLRGMTDDQRIALADDVIFRMGGTEQYEAFKEGRDNLRATMPEFQAFQDWQKWMRDLAGGDIAAARTTLMEWSPGYRAYIDGLDSEFKQDPETFDRMSLSVDAYLAASGKPASVYADDPSDATDISSIPANVLLSGSGGESKGGSGGSKPDTAVSRLEKLNKDIAEYEKDMAAFNAKVREITGGALYEDLAPMWQESLKRRLDREGIKVPRKPSTVENYEEWLALNPDGTKMAYIEWLMENDI